MVCALVGLLEGLSYGFYSNHVWIWELDHKESWVPKNWCFWTVILEKTLESPLDCKIIQPVHPKGNQSWIFIGRTDAEAKVPIVWPPDLKNWLIRKDPDAGKDWGQEKGKTEGETVGWSHWLSGHEFEQPSGYGEGQVSLVCCSPWGHKELDTIEQLDWGGLNEMMSSEYLADSGLTKWQFLWETGEYSVCPQCYPTLKF